MTRAIDRDQQRFRNIVRGKVRENLKKYVTHGEMLGRKGREIVSIPVPNLEIPHFRHGQKGSGGVGQGEGDVGQPIGRGQDDESGKGQAGDQPGGHIREVEISLDELADMLGAELELPNIEPKGKDTIKSKKDRYTTVRQTGPDSLRHFKRTYKRALKRQLATNEYNPNNPIIVPTRDDERFRSWKSLPEYEANAAIIYMMDVSGSMGDEDPAPDGAAEGSRVRMDRAKETSAMTRPAPARHAFTLIEVLVVATIVAIAGAIIVPHMLTPSDWGVQAAGRIVIADLLFAQNEAIARQAPRRVVFDPDDNSYRVTDTAGNIVDVPFRGGAYTIDFDEDRRFAGVGLENVAFGVTDPPVVEFDPLGTPSEGGTIDVATNTTRYRITVAPITGRVTIAPQP